VRIIYRD